MFKNILGQDHALQILHSAIEHDRVSQAYLFHGPEGVGKFTTALYFGMALNCLAKSEFRPCGVCNSCRRLLNLDHPDFIYLFPTLNLRMTDEGEIRDNLDSYEAYIQNKKDSPWLQFHFNRATEIRRESVAFLIKRLSLSIFDANYRICLIENADMMNIQTSNAFLKILEEPPARTVMLLTTSRLSSLLPTILSRCQPIYFRPLSQSVTESLLRNKLEYDEPTARAAARIGSGNFKTAVQVAEGSSQGLRDLAFQIMELAMGDKELDFVNLIDSLKDQLNAESAKNLLSYMGFLVNDIAVLRSNPEEITNIDKLDELKKLARDDDIFIEDVLKFLGLLEDFQRKIAGKVNLRLLMMNCFYALKDLYRSA